MSASYVTYAEYSAYLAPAESIADYTLAIPVGHTDLVVCVCLTFLSASISNVSVTVGGQSASLVSGTTSTGTEKTSMIYAVALGDTSGNKTVSVSWTGSAYASACSVCIDGAHQTTLANNGAVSSGVGDSASITLTGTSTGVTVACVAVGETPTACGETSIHTGAFGGLGIGYSYATGEVSPTHTWTVTSDEWVMSGVNVPEVAATGQFARPASVYFSRRLRS